MSGRAEPLFIIATDTFSNTVYVGQGQRHPGLYRRALRILPGDVHWVSPDRRFAAGKQAPFSFRIRYRQPLQGGVLHLRADGAYIVFDSPQRGITPDSLPRGMREKSWSVRVSSLNSRRVHNSAVSVPGTARRTLFSSSLRRDADISLFAGIVVRRPFAGDVACRLQFDISLQIVKIEIMEEILESGRRRYLAPAVESLSFAAERGIAVSVQPTGNSIESVGEDTLNSSSADFWE